MSVSRSMKIKLHFKSYSQGDVVIDAVTTGILQKRGKLIRIEYNSCEDMPKGKTSMILHDDDCERIKITRDGESPLIIDAENGTGLLSIGYNGCYTLKGTVEKVKTSIVHENESMFDVEISYIMNAGGMKNSIRQIIRVFELEEF